ncbi:PREDICTED: uncharacterized protein LOC109166645 [Ipomoea nil]|uniref:uncharacterized protein LOC109166645 n=1 Tax=Ipomoea nil TaxID=35883 RepID=UPI0009019FDC|nr:PREDICTED: uncharacterized protein LOC109166645 [Ipomoea nil]
MEEPRQAQHVHPETHAQVAEDLEIEANRAMAFERLRPAMRQRLGPQDPNRRSVDSPMRAASQEGSSGHSGSKSHRRRRAREPAQTAVQDETRGLLNELRAEFTRWKNEHVVRPPTDHSASLLRTPFTVEIKAQPYPLDLRILGNKEYDGRTDSEVHVNTYYGNMMMMGVADVVMCRAFYSTLSGRAAEWFRTLQPGSISDFATLAAKFMRKFVTSKVIQKPYMYLEKAKQLEGESLTEFLVKWKAAVGEVEPMDDLTAIHMLHISLRAGYLYQDFILHPPTTYEEAPCRVTDYANAGEANAVKRSQEVGASSQKPPDRADHRPVEDHPRPRTWPGEFTALNRSAAEAMQYAQSCNLIRLPQMGWIRRNIVLTIDVRGMTRRNACI